jgi:hypothetical protein
MVRQPETLIRDRPGRDGKRHQRVRNGRRRPKGGGAELIALQHRLATEFRNGGTSRLPALNRGELIGAVFRRRMRLHGAMAPCMPPSRTVASSGH